MVFLRDEGSVFDAPIDVVWQYLLGGEAHDAAHTTTRNPTFEKVSDLTILYGSERYLRGKWAPDKLRISTFPPVAVVTEWLEGVLAGSRFVYLYSPHRQRTRIDVYGEFTSKSLPAEEVEAAAREFLDTEYAADAPALRAEARRRTKEGTPPAAR